MRPLLLILCTSLFIPLLVASPTTLQANDYTATESASIVQISEVDGRAVLKVNGEPFAVNGAGMGYRDEAGIESLAMAGGNAFRTWDTDDLGARLDAARKHGLLVLAGAANAPGPCLEFWRQSELPDTDG